MELDFDLRRPQERVMMKLRRRYELFGYRKYKVSNFEEYSLYLQYKNFLSGERILSFTDLDGRLLALRPDVTLSIIKNAPQDETAKAYYIETVYRESKESNTFKEINQMGLEYMGRVDAYAVAEVAALAQQSLAVCAEECAADYLLEIGHMGFAGGLLEMLELTAPERARIAGALAAKSPHLLGLAAQDMGLCSADGRRLQSLLDLSGKPDDVLAKAEYICTGRKMQAALDELAGLCAALADDGRVRLDLGLLNATEFYDGVLMQGYLAGLPRPVLSGGRYDSMMKKLGKSAGAIGFALYLDELERLPLAPRDYDVDVWLSYDEGESAAELLAKAEEIAASGETVRVGQKIPPELRYRRHLHMAGGEVSQC